MRSQEQGTNSHPPILERTPSRLDRPLAGATRTLGASSAALLLLGLSSCGGEGKGGAPPSATASSSVAAPATSAAPASSAQAAAQSPSAVVGSPVPPEVVARTVNPRKEAPYSGPTGTLKGRVRIKGDPPPPTEFAFPSGKCGEAAATYSHLFRVGQGGALGDALVSVVGYDGYVPEKEEATKVTIHGCALSRRTVVATFGQRIEIANLDVLESYMPYLDGGSSRAVMVAVPRGDAVKLYPPQAGHYLIRDQMPKPFMTADVFVLKYATHDVTGLDGTYEITGIPVGTVQAVAYLPALNDEAKQEIKIVEGANTLDFELSFDLGKWKARTTKHAAPAPSSSASASPPRH
ncbi:hypothetical protein [Chondromyces apiculatus]|nr:hypothetical protein [Chondromyces apiculatus]